MSKLMKRAAATAVLIAAMMGGFFVGYRATMTHAEVYCIGPETVAITVWGLTDLYYMEAVG